MSLHLITGPATAGKTKVLIEYAFERAAHAGLPVVVVPAEPDVRRAQDLLGRDGLHGVRIVQFDRWFDDLWRAQGDGRALVTPVTRSALMSRAADQVDSELKPRSWTPGVTAVFSDMVQRIDRERMVHEKTEPWIPGVLERYWELLEESGLIERADAVAVMARGGLSVSGPVALNHFTDLTWSQEELVLSLARCTSVGVALTWVKDREATRALDPLIARLLGAGASHTVVSEGRWTHPGLQWIGESVFEATLPLGPCDALEMVEVAGVGGESSAIADRVARLMVEGFAAAEVAVVARDMGARAEQLTNAFAARGVPASADVARPFLRTSFGRALRALVGAVIDSEATREDVLGYLLSPFSGVDPQDVRALDRNLRVARPRGSQLLARSLPREMSDAVNIVRRMARADRGDGREIADLWHRLGSRMLTEALSAPGADAHAAVSAAAHRALMSTVGELLRASQPIDPMSVMTALGAVVMSPAAGPADAVVLTEAHRLKGRRFRAVIIMGLNADEFAPRRDPRLAAELARSLGGRSGPDERSVERMLFYMLLTRASDRLILSRQAVGEGHEVMVPSVFWDEVAALVSETGCTRVRVPAAVSLPTSIPGRLGERLSANRPSAEPARFRVSDDARRALRSSLEERELSPSQFERYLSCPYRWYLDYSLRPREVDVIIGPRETGSISHALLKAFYDQWIQLGHRRVTPPLLSEALRVLSEVERTHLPGWEARAEGLSEEIAIASARARARAIITDDADITPGFVPEGHEIAFGQAAGHELSFGGVRMAGRIDRVDVGPAGVLAVDYKSSSEVSGASRFEDRGLLQPIVYAVAASGILGAPIAGGVYRSLSSLRVRGFWLEDCVDLGGRGSSKDGMSSHAIDELIGRAETRVRVAYESMTAGHIEPAPGTGCKHCPYGPLCGRGAT